MSTSTVDSIPLFPIQNRNPILSHDPAYHTYRYGRPQVRIRLEKLGTVEPAKAP